MKHAMFILLSALSLSVSGQSWTNNGNDIYYTAGKVGIGTSSPSNLLHVIYSSNPTSAATGSYFVTNQSVTNTATITSLGSSFKATHSTGDIVQAIGIGATCENNGTGNVSNLKGIQGIGYLSGPGTATGAYGVVGAVSVTGSGTVTNAYGLFGTVSINGSGAVTNGYGVYVQSFSSAVTNKWGVYVADANAKNYFNGSVMIGTTTNYNYKLAVNGNAIFTEAKVRLYANWPDYVFNKKYNLLPITELEKFIEKYHHLPNIPSADEIKKNEGFELGDMNLKLLQKIEELTLYIIQLKKETDQIKEQLKIYQGTAQ